MACNIRYPYCQTLDLLLIVSNAAGTIAPQADCNTGDDEPVWRRLTFEESARRGLQRAPHQGTLHLLAQSAVLRWHETGPNDFPLGQSEKLRIPPIFIGSTPASTLYEAISGSLPGLDLADVFQLSTKLAVLSLGGDQDGGVKNSEGRRNSRCCWCSPRLPFPLFFIFGFCSLRVLARFMSPRADIESISAIQTFEVEVARGPTRPFEIDLCHPGLRSRRCPGPMPLHCPLPRGRGRTVSFLERLLRFLRQRSG